MYLGDRRRLPAGICFDRPRDHTGRQYWCSKDVVAEPPLHVARYAQRIAALTRRGRAMVDTDGFPEVVRGPKRRQEYPSRRARVETWVELEPSPDIGFGAADQNGDLRYPPAVDLQGAKIVGAVRVADLGPNPAAFLIAQAPERAFKPRPAISGLTNTLCYKRFRLGISRAFAGACPRRRLTATASEATQRRTLAGRAKRASQVMLVSFCCGDDLISVRHHDRVRPDAAAGFDAGPAEPRVQVLRYGRVRDRIGD